MNNGNVIESGILGLCIADALGVPAEFQSREALREKPVTDMCGFGTHGQPAGTWSDDSAMTLCLADSLAEKGGFEPEDVMRRFALWLGQGEYTANGVVFDVGVTCASAIRRFNAGVPALECGGKGERDNGNGALMRILPMALLLHARYGRDIFGRDEAIDTIHAAASLTHAHPRNLIACGVYTAIAAELAGGSDAFTATLRGIQNACLWYQKQEVFGAELPHYMRLYFSWDDVKKGRVAKLGHDYARGFETWEENGPYAIPFPSRVRFHALTAFANLPEDEIRSSGYAVDTLEAALWCLLNTTGYAECVCRAVNLGGDTDTVAAVAGGLAGILYGADGIPEAWRAVLARREWVLSICGRLSDALQKTPYC
jgi:ADP-ribosylglycohydrolase